MTLPRQLAPFSHRFESFVAPARKRPAIWRLIAGTVLLTGLMFAVMFGVIWAIEQAGGSLTWLDFENQDRLEAARGLLFILGSLATAWVVLPIVTGILHRRGLRSLIGRGAGGLARWVIGGLTACIVIASASLGSAAIGVVEVPIWQGIFEGWITYAFIGATFIVFQASAEELIFRGYLVQQLAARFRAPLMWGMIPALLFGFLHYDPALPTVFRVGYIALTTTFALLMTYSVYRTGSLHFAIGFHVVNNWLAMLLVSPEGTPEMSALALWVAPTPGAGELLIYFLVETIVVITMVEGVLMKKERFV